jgi:hypothetical protein
MAENRGALERSLATLRGELQELTDWRKQVRKHSREAAVAAAAVGFLVGLVLVPRRRRR